LMSTGQVKFSQAGEGGKGKKTGQELDKIMKAANNFYNAMNDEEGAGRFPGQDKWDKTVPRGTDSEGNSNGEGYASLGACLADLVEGQFDSYRDAHLSGGSGTFGKNWCSVFGKDEKVSNKPSMHKDHKDKISDDDAATEGDNPTASGADSFKEYMEPIASPFLDGHYIYTVIAGNVEGSPAIVVTDFYAPADEFSIAQP